MGFSASDYIDDLLGQTNYLPPDIFIDDREIPEAKNAYEFSMTLGLFRTVCLQKDYL